VKKEIGLIVILFILFAGCIGSPPKMDNPLSSAPGMIMDYDKKTNLTKIWVRGEATDYKYSNITITISKDEMETVSTEDNTYCLQYNINLSSFSLQIEVWTENTRYEYTCNVTVCELGLIDETYPVFTIVDSKHSEEEPLIKFEKDLPFTKVLEEVKK
jgi:hypothetical protein